MEPTRLSKTELMIINLLGTVDRAYGLELIDRSGGVLKRGTVYVLLERLSKRGLVESEKEPAQPGQQGPPRRLYWLTGQGVRTLNAYRAMIERYQLDGSLTLSPAFSFSL